MKKDEIKNEIIAHSVGISRFLSPDYISAFFRLT